jgi:hypothetical protein
MRLHPSREAVLLHRTWVPVAWLYSELGTQEATSLLQYLRVNSGSYAFRKAKELAKLWEASAGAQEERASLKRLVGGVFSHG